MLDYRIPFLMGAVLGGISLILAQCIRLPAHHDETVKAAC
jgi:hypothetical protein